MKRLRCSCLNCGHSCLFSRVCKQYPNKLVGPHMCANNMQTNEARRQCVDYVRTNEACADTVYTMLKQTKHMQTETGKVQTNWQTKPKKNCRQLHFFWHCLRMFVRAWTNCLFAHCVRICQHIACAHVQTTIVADKFARMHFFSDVVRLQARSAVGLCNRETPLAA